MMQNRNRKTKLLHLVILTVVVILLSEVACIGSDDQPAGRSSSQIRHPMKRRSDQMIDNHKQQPTQTSMSGQKWNYPSTDRSVRSNLFVETSKDDEPINKKRKTYNVWTGFDAGGSTSSTVGGQSSSQSYNPFSQISNKYLSGSSSSGRTSAVSSRRSSRHFSQGRSQELASQGVNPTGSGKYHWKRQKSLMWQTSSQRRNGPVTRSMSLIDNTGQFTHKTPGSDFT